MKVFVSQVQYLIVDLPKIGIFCINLINLVLRNFLDEWLFQEDWLPVGDALKRELEHAKAHNGELREETLASPNLSDGQSFAEWLREKLLKYPKSPI